MFAKPRNSPLTRTSAIDLARLIRDRVVSPVEVVEATLDAISDRNPSLNALVFVDAEGAREAARRSERQLMQGSRLGPLHGVPTALKDLFDFKPGWPVTYGGIPALRGRTANGWCTYAQRLEAAGAIMVGKGNSPVMGIRGTCDNPMFGPTRNPFNVSFNSGGSSGGCAAAVADCMLPIAEGGDGGGSIRIPASWCGIYGFLPSFGRVPSVARSNAYLIDPFMSEGPLTRSVADAALAMTVLAAPDPRDPFSLPTPWEPPDLGHASVDGLRIGYTTDYGGFPVDRRIGPVIASAVHDLEAAGALVSDLDFRLPFDQAELSELWFRLILPSNVELFDALAREGLDIPGDYPQDLPAEYRRRLGAARRSTVSDRARDQAMRTAVLDAFLEAFANFDLIVGPTVCALPVLNQAGGETAGPCSIEGVEVDPLIGWCPTYLVNFIGSPAASVPVGLADGLPVGLHIIGRRHADALVLSASAVLERVRPWAQLYRIPRDRNLKDRPGVASTRGDPNDCV